MKSKLTKADSAHLLRAMIEGPNGTQGRDFINVMVNLYLDYGKVHYGMQFKSESGEVDFSTLEEAIEIVNGLRVRMGYPRMEYEDVCT